jgi:hypothetical protein
MTFGGGEMRVKEFKKEASMAIGGACR